MSQALPPSDDGPTPSNRPPSAGKLKLLALIWTGGILLSIGSAAVIGLQVDRWKTEQSSSKLWFDQAKKSLEEGNYEDCWKNASLVPEQSVWFEQAQLVKRQCEDENKSALGKIEQAIALANSRQLKEALDLIRTIDSPAHQSIINQLKQKWAYEILNIAQYFYLDPSVDQLEEAIAVANVITPDCSPVYELAQTRIVQWRQEWQKNASHFQAAQTALGTGDLAQAEIEIAQLTLPFWINQARRLRQQIASSAL